MKRASHTVEAPPAGVLDWLARADAADIRASRRKSLFGCLTAFFLFGGFALFFVASNDEVWSTVAGVGVGLAILFLILAIFYETRDLDEAKIAACRGFVRVLAADLPPARPVRLTVDYRDYASGTFRLSREGAYYGEQRSTYRQPWLSFEGRLLDGTGLRVRVVRRAERLDYWKKSGSKNKRKYKDKVTDRIAVHLTAPGRAAAPGGGPPLDLASRAVRVAGNTVSAVLVAPRARRSTRVNLAPGDLADARRLLAAVAWLHRGLRNP